MALVVAGCSGDDADEAATLARRPPRRRPGTTATAVSVAAPPPPFGEATDPVVIGHRGAAGHFPDNSLEGFAGAATSAPTWVELDVRLSADGDVFLSHDPETAGRARPWPTASSADLAAEGIPTLLEALDVIDENHLGVDVEIKSDPDRGGLRPQPRHGRRHHGGAPGPAARRARRGLLVQPRSPWTGCGS